MRKLEDIPKKSVFKVPDGYFEHLPTTIQSRITKEGRRSSAMSVVGFSLRYVLPVLALVVFGIFWLQPGPSIESQFEDIDTDQIALYLETTEHIDIEDTDDASSFTTPELDQLEDEVYSNMDYPSEEFLDDLDLENL